MTVDPRYRSIPWLQEGLSFIPITKYPFSQKEINLSQNLDHRFEDLKHIFPSWEGFLNRSLGNNPNYPNYMKYLLCKSKENEIIGLLAVQLIEFENLFKKNKAVHPRIKDYVYLSWIGVDYKYRSLNYFTLLFEYYYTLIIH